MTKRFKLASLRSITAHFRLDPDDRSVAVFGMFDGVVSVIGFVYGLLLHGAHTSVIAIGGLGGAVSATVSMGTGQFEEASGQPNRLKLTGVMAAATLVGSLVPVWPFFVFGRRVSLVLGGIGAMAVALWIGKEKQLGLRGYLEAYATMVGAAGLSLLVVAFIPSSIGG